MKQTSQRIRLVKAMALAALWSSLGTAQTHAGRITPPPVPPPIQVPTGNTPFLLGHAVGTQNYICLPSGDTGVWTFYAPQATLFVTPFGDINRQIITHFLSPDPFVPSPTPTSCVTFTGAPNTSCPTWQGSIDSSLVWGSKIGSINAGSDPSCPESGAIACLLLQAVGTQEGSHGSKGLANTTYIQRLNTTGGSAPTTSCVVGNQILVPYTADYYFYRSSRE